MQTTEPKAPSPPPSEHSAPGGRAQPPTRAQKLVRGAGLAGLVAVFVVALAVATLGLLRLSRTGVLPGVTVEGIDVGGLGEEDLRAELAAFAQSEADFPITFAYAGNEISTTMRALGYQADTETAALSALAVGRSGGIFASSADQITAFWEDTAFTIEGGIDPARLDAWVDEVADEIYRDAFHGDLEFNVAEGTVATLLPEPGIELDRATFAELTLDAITTESPEPMSLPTIAIEPRSDSGDIATIGRRVELALTRPLVFTSDDVSVSISPSELVGALRFDLVEQDGGLVPELSADVSSVRQIFSDHVDAIFVPAVEPDVAVPPVEDLPVLDEKGDVTWSPQAPGLFVTLGEEARAFNAELASEQMLGMIRSGSARVELLLTTIEGELPNAFLEGFDTSKVIGTFTTYHRCCQNRVTNIHQIADTVRGTIVLPGEQFSINEVVGRRTREKGYLPAGAIFQGELRDEVGGGVSQFATTIFNALFFSGMQIDEYKAHSLYITRYPRGREATLNFPIINFAFTNDTEFPVMVHTSYTATSITVTVFGDNGGREVEAVMGSPYSWTSAAEVRRVNPELGPGVEKVVQSGGRGFSVQVLQIIRWPDGTETEKVYTTRYAAPPRVIEYGLCVGGTEPPCEEPPPEDPPPEDPPPEDPPPEDPPPEDPPPEDPPPEDPPPED